MDTIKAQQQARYDIHQFAKLCMRRSYTRMDWNDRFMEIPGEILVADDLVPDAWEHVGYFVWLPMR